MDQAVWKRRVKDDLEPVFDNELSNVVDRIPCRCLHPTIDGQNPKCRHKRTQCNHCGGKEVQLWTYPGPTKQHDAQKTGLKEERRHHLIAHQGSQHRPRLIRKDTPVRPELVTHHDAGHHAHTKGDCEDFFPIIKQGEVDLFAGPEMQTIEHGHIARQTNGEGGKNNVKADREGKLNACKRQCI